MKPILVDACNNFDHGKSTCTKCGRSLPDVCLEFEQMKQKADEYDRLGKLPSAVMAPSAADPVPVVKKRGPRAKNAAD